MLNNVAFYMQDVNSGGPWRQPGHSGRDRTDGEVEKDYKAFLCIKILKLSPRNNWALLVNMLFTLFVSGYGGL